MNAYWGLFGQIPVGIRRSLDVQRTFDAHLDQIHKLFLRTTFPQKALTHRYRCYYLKVFQTLNSHKFFKTFKYFLKFPDAFLKVDSLDQFLV